MTICIWQELELEPEPEPEINNFGSATLLFCIIFQNYVKYRYFEVRKHVNNVENGLLSSVRLFSNISTVQKSIEKGSAYLRDMVLKEHTSHFM